MPEPMTDGDAWRWIRKWNAECHEIDQPKPPPRGTPGTKWEWDTPAGRRTRRRLRAGLAKIKDDE